MRARCAPQRAHFRSQKCASDRQQQRRPPPLMPRTRHKGRRRSWSATHTQLVGIRLQGDGPIGWQAHERGRAVSGGRGDGRRAGAVTPGAAPGWIRAEPETHEHIQDRHEDAETTDPDHAHLQDDGSVCRQARERGQAVSGGVDDRRGAGAVAQAPRQAGRAARAGAGQVRQLVRLRGRCQRVRQARRRVAHTLCIAYMRHVCKLNLPKALNEAVQLKNGLAHSPGTPPHNTRPRHGLHAHLHIPPEAMNEAKS